MRQPYFILQAENPGVVSTEVATVLEALEFKAWHDGTDMENDYCFSPLSGLNVLLERMAHVERDICPVGSVEFCNAVLQHRYHVGPIRAMNVPAALAKPAFLHREIIPDATLGRIENIISATDAKELFIKPARHCKIDFEGGAQILTEMSAKAYLPKLIKEHGEDFPVFASTVFQENIQSEWRIFVYRDMIRGIRPYILDEWVMPAELDVRRMVEAYRSDPERPPAYTLDVAVLEDGEIAVIEVHPFIACGFYGFTGGSELLPMLHNAVRWEVQQQIKQSDA